MRKDDSGKLDYSLLGDLPNAIEAVVGVMDWAIKGKETPYVRGSWQQIPNADQRLRAAEERHQANIDQADVCNLELGEFDSESNILHLAHRAASVLMRLELTIRAGGKWKKSD